MIKYIQTNCLSVFDYFVGLALKGLRGLLLKKVYVVDSLAWQRERWLYPLHLEFQFDAHKLYRKFEIKPSPYQSRTPFSNLW